MSGYVEGPTLHHNQRPWPIMWESQSGLDDCAHEWERCILLADGPARWRADEVIRCPRCMVPRCGDTNDADPCMERRHHASLHIYLSGRFEPLGGLLPTEEPTP